jgi:hypothetical protein
MSPDSNSSGEQVKDFGWAENATKTPPPVWPIDDESTPHAKEKTISDGVSTPANGQSSMSCSYRKAPSSSHVGSKYVPSWVKSTASQPNIDAPAPKEPKGPRPKSPSPPDSLPTPSDDQEIKPPWTRSGKKEASQSPPSISVESTQRADEKTVSDTGTMSANGRNQQQSSMSRSYQKPPPLSQVGSKFVPPWVKSTANQPYTDAPAKKESKWSGPKAPSSPDRLAADLSDEQDTRSPPWTRSGKKEAPQSPPSSPSRKILDKVKTRRQPGNLKVSGSAAQSHAEPVTSNDCANLVLSYGGAVIETPKYFIFFRRFGAESKVNVNNSDDW